MLGINYSLNGGSLTWETWLLLGLIILGLFLLTRVPRFYRRLTYEWNERQLRKDRLKRMDDMPALFLSGAIFSRSEAVLYHQGVEHGLKLPKAWGITDREKFSSWLLDSGNRAKVDAAIEDLKRGKLGMFSSSFDVLGRAVINRVAEHGFTLEDFNLTVQGVEVMVKSAKVNWAREEAERIDRLKTALDEKKKEFVAKIESWGFTVGCDDLDLRNVVEHSNFWGL
jgi:hypothetical protein